MLHFGRQLFYMASPNAVILIHTKCIWRLLLPCSSVLHAVTAAGRYCGAKNPSVKQVLMWAPLKTNGMLSEGKLLLLQMWNQYTEPLGDSHSVSAEACHWPWSLGTGESMRNPLPLLQHGLSLCTGKLLTPHWSSLDISVSIGTGGSSTRVQLK